MMEQAALKKGKLSADERTMRRQAIIDYIRENKEVRSRQICQAFDITSRSSLSDDMKVILKTGLIESPRRGVYRYCESADPARIPVQMEEQHIRRWLLLALLGGSALTFEEIHDVFTRHSDYQKLHCSKTTLRHDLSVLRSRKLISVRRSKYHSSVIYAASGTEIRDYLNHPSTFADSRVQVAAHKLIREHLSHILGDIVVLNNSPDCIRQSGRQNNLSLEQIEQFSVFSGYAYKDRVLELDYRTSKGEMLHCSFETGMIVYSVETNQVYLVGKDELKRLTIIPLQNLVPETIHETGKKNHSYRSASFNRTYNEMLNISFDKPVDVLVRFQNLTHVAEKVRQLASIRKDQASLEITADGKELLYRDRIRGLDDFARYLRTFGNKVIVEKPEALRGIMLNTSYKILDLYAEQEDRSHAVDK